MFSTISSIQQVLQQNRSSDERFIIVKLNLQSLVIKSMWEFVDNRLINQWSNVISHLPRNIFSFAIRSLNNTLRNETNSIKWGIGNSTTCMFCDQQKNPGHIIGRCETALLESRLHSAEYL